MRASFSVCSRKSAMVDAVCITNFCARAVVPFRDVELQVRSARSVMQFMSRSSPERAVSGQFCSSTGRIAAQRRKGGGLGQVGVRNLARGENSDVCNCSSCGEGSSAASSNLSGRDQAPLVGTILPQLHAVAREANAAPLLPTGNDELQFAGSSEAEVKAEVSVSSAHNSTLDTDLSLGSVGRPVSDLQARTSSRLPFFAKLEDVENKYIDRAINICLAGSALAFGVNKFLTVDHDYWQGWTVYEILRYAPMHNWNAYEEALRDNPVLAKMMISGFVYAFGDWIAQCSEGKPVFEYDRGRVFRSGLVGFSLHGSLSHFYYRFCEALFPFQGWWVVPLKVAFDQTIWSAIWNSIYYVMIGLLRQENPVTIYKDLKASFFPMLTAGWKLWPFAHIITYGVVPVEQRLLWVDCVEVVWVTILSVMSNENSEARSLEGGAKSEASADVRQSDETNSNMRNEDSV